MIHGIQRHYVSCCVLFVNLCSYNRRREHPAVFTLPAEKSVSVDLGRFVKHYYIIDKSRNMLFCSVIEIQRHSNAVVLPDIVLIVHTVLMSYIRSTSGSTRQRDHDRNNDNYNQCSAISFRLFFFIRSVANKKSSLFSNQAASDINIPLSLPKTTETPTASSAETQADASGPEATGYRSAASKHLPSHMKNT